MLKPPGHSIQTQPPYEGLFALQVKIKKKNTRINTGRVRSFQQQPESWSWDRRAVEETVNTSKIDS